MRLEPPSVLFASVVHTVYRRVSLHYLSSLDYKSRASRVPPRQFLQNSYGGLTFPEGTLLKDEIMFMSQTELPYILKHDIIITNCFLLYKEFKFMCKNYNKSVISYWDCFQIEPKFDRTMMNFYPEDIMRSFEKVGSLGECALKIYRGEKLALPKELDTALNLMLGIM